MRKSLPFLLSVYLFAAAVSARARPQNVRYVYDGKILQIMQEDPCPVEYQRWQIWLYQEGVHIPRYAAGLQYSRWGLMRATPPKRYKATPSFTALRGNIFEILRCGHVGPVYVLQSAWSHRGKRPAF